MVNSDDQTKFNDHIKTINKQIKQIEKLINEFSEFARMPKPDFKKNDIVSIIKDNIKLLKEIDLNTEINFKTFNKNIILNCDAEQISRVFLNLIKIALESIDQRYEKTPNFVKKIDIDISNINDYIQVEIADNGIGFSDFDRKNLFKPYFTTKKKGSGLGLSIVNKIINDHTGSIEFLKKSNGAKVILKFPNNVNWDTYNRR